MGKASALAIMTTSTPQQPSQATRWRRKLCRLAVLWGLCLVASVWVWHLFSWPYALVPLGLAFVIRVLLPGAPRNRRPDSVAGRILWLAALFLVFWAPPVRALMKGLTDRLWTLDSLQFTLGLSCLCILHVLRYCEWLRSAPLADLLAYYDEGAGGTNEAPPKD